MNILDYLLQATLNEKVVKGIKATKEWVRLLDDKIKTGDLDYTLEQKYQEEIQRVKKNIIEAVDKYDPKAFEIASKRMVYDLTTKEMR